MDIRQNKADLADGSDKAMSPQDSDANRRLGQGITYNHDLKVSAAFLNAFPLIKGLLVDERLINWFDVFDADAKRNKRRFQSLGFISLILGSLALITAAVRAMLDEQLLRKFVRAELGFEACALVSVGLVVLIWLRQYRAKWCWAMFCRERVRQWHFQLFLDGQFVGLYAHNRSAFDDEFDRRWNRLMESLRYGFGELSAFVHSASRDRDFLHDRTDYDDERLAATVCDALQVLRITHQLAYSRRKAEADGGESLNMQTHISEQVAAVTLGAAVLLTGIGFFTSIWALATEPAWETIAMRGLGGMALVLVVVSAASRAYRAGFTLPDELENYEEYCDRLREIEAVFQRLADPVGKLRQLEELEEESAAELRRFLRMKMRATFVS